MLDQLTVERMAREPIAVGLSGGGDSSALLLLLIERFGTANLRAFVVDHALREGSRIDAERARAFAVAHGVRADILTLFWAPDSNRGQQGARRGRYRAICEAMRAENLRILALGHTADDQAETMLMRAAGGSSWRGLAGIAPFAAAPVWPEGRDVFVARPLLAQRREALRAFLREHGASWIDDPANANPDYERVRVRAKLAALEAAGFDPLRLVALAAKLRVRVAALDQLAAALIAAASRCEDDTILLTPDRWQGGASVRQRALAVLIAAAAGAERLPAPEAVERLDRQLGPGFRGATLGGASVAVTRAGWIIGRDPGALLGRSGGGAALADLPLEAGVEKVWDGRLAVTAPAPGWLVAAGASGPRLEQGGATKTLVAARGRWLLQSRIESLLAASGINSGKP